MRCISFAVTLVACGPKAPQGSWIEREMGQTHVEDGSAAAPVIDVDVARLDAAAIEVLDEASVRAALDKVGDAAPAARLALRGARLAWHRGDDAIVRAWIARAASAADHATVASELSELGAKLGRAQVEPKVIAVLLPLSGRYAGIGSELKLAIQLAPALGTTWWFVDTKGEPDGAAAAVEQAAAKGAIAILGPVGEREGLAAARAASLQGIPIALLAPADGADPSAGVFRVVESPADEGRAIAHLAHTESFPTVAVFAPRDDVGGESAAAFVAEAQRLGLQVTGQGTYDPTGGNLEPDVKEFLNLVPAKNPRFADHLARKGKKGWTTFSPDITFSLLYVPDRYDRAALVAAFLPYYNVELRTTEFPDPARLMRKHGGVMPQVVQLIGGAGWHHPTLAIRGGPAMQGAMFVDAFAGDLGADTAAQFAADFLDRAKRQPSSAAAQAHDAATLFARVRRDIANAPDPRTAFRTSLSRAKLDDGACGPAAMGADGELTREPSVFEVQGEQLLLVP